MDGFFDKHTYHIDRFHDRFWIDFFPQRLNGNFRILLVRALPFETCSEPRDRPNALISGKVPVAALPLAHLERVAGLPEVRSQTTDHESFISIYCTERHGLTLVSVPISQVS